MKSPQSPHSSSLWVFALSLRVLSELSPPAPISHLGTMLFSTVLVCLALGSSHSATPAASAAPAIWAAPPLKGFHPIRDHCVWSRHYHLVFISWSTSATEGKVWTYLCTIWAYSVAERVFHVSQLISDYVKPSDVQEWLDVKVGVAILILDFAKAYLHAS